MKFPDNDDFEKAIDHFGREYYAELMREALFSVFIEGSEWMASQFLTYIEKYREAYGEDIFPTEDLSQFDPKIVTAVSGRMGRFILDNIIRDLEGMK